MSNNLFPRKRDPRLRKKFLRHGGSSLQLSGAAALAGSESSVISASFIDNTMVIRDPITGGNAFEGAPFSKLTFTRATAAWYFNSLGLLTQASSGTPRIDYGLASNTIKGLLIEESRTNVVLHCDDQSNAAWVKTNMTAAKDQTGIDGVANSASSLTATSGNATSLQSITLGSSARYQSAYVKRITGSGTVEMTMDNGSTWTAITVTSSWTRVEIPTQTLANPIVGFRIVTSGDAIAVCGVQNEDGAFATSVILTTTAAVTRNADDVSISATLFNLTQAAGTLYVRGSVFAVTSGNQHGLAVKDGTTNELHRVRLSSSGALSSMSTIDGGVTQSSVTIGGIVVNTTYKMAGVYALNDFHHYRDGVAGTPDTSGTLPTTDRLNVGNLGNANHLNGWLREFMFAGRRLTNGELQVLTTP